MNKISMSYYTCDFVCLNPEEKNLQCENCSEKDIFKLYFKGEEYLCDNCVEEENKEEEYDRIYDELEKRINPKILMVPNAPPVSNRNDSYSESLIRRINNKILRLKLSGALKTDRNKFIKNPIVQE